MTLTDSDLLNIIRVCEHSLDVVALVSKYGGASPIQNRAAVGVIQAKCEAELERRAAAKEAAEEARMDAGGEEPVETPEPESAKEG